MIYDTVIVNILQDHLVNNINVKINDISFKENKLFIKNKGYNIILADQQNIPVCFIPDYEGFPRLLCKNNDVLLDLWLEDIILTL